MRELDETTGKFTLRAARFSPIRSVGIRATPLERLRIRTIACRNQWVVGRFNANSQAAGCEEQLFLQSIAIVGGPGNCECAEINHFAIIWPWLSRIPGLVAGRGQLGLDMERHRPF